MKENRRTKDKKNFIFATPEKNENSEDFIAKNSALFYENEIEIIEEKLKYEKKIEILEIRQEYEEKCVIFNCKLNELINNYHGSYEKNYFTESMKKILNQLQNHIEESKLQLISFQNEFRLNFRKNWIHRKVNLFSRKFFKHK